MFSCNFQGRGEAMCWSCIMRIWTFLPLVISYLCHFGPALRPSISRFKSPAFPMGFASWMLFSHPTCCEVRPRAFCSKLQWLPCHCCLGRTHCHGAAVTITKLLVMRWIVIWIPNHPKWWISDILLVKYIFVYIDDIIDALDVKKPSFCTLTELFFSQLLIARGLSFNFNTSIAGWKMDPLKMHFLLIRDFQPAILVYPDVRLMGFFSRRSLTQQTWKDEYVATCWTVCSLMYDIKND